MRLQEAVRDTVKSVVQEVRIRPARASDVGGIVECLHSAFEPYRSAYTATAFAATVLTTTTAKRRVRSMTVWVAVGRQGRILGTVAVKRASPRHAHLRGMAVLPEYQGQGIASALLEHTVRRARAKGFRYVTLETTEPLTNAARFYLSHGFRRTGRSRHWGGMKLIGFERRIRNGSPPGRELAR